MINLTHSAAAAACAWKYAAKCDVWQVAKGKWLGMWERHAAQRTTTTTKAKAKRKVTDPRAKWQPLLCWQCHTHTHSHTHSLTHNIHTSDSLLDNNESINFTR